MKLHVSRARQPGNLKVMEKVLNEFESGRTVELNHERGANFLVWNDSTAGVHHTILVAIPEAWLENLRDASKLEATTRNFAGCVANFATPPRGVRIRPL